MATASLTRTERFLRACRGEPVDRPPVWLMRQAGRYLPEYRAARAGVSFLEACQDVERAVEISLQPLRLVGTEAVILFSDIFMPVLGMGVDLDFRPGPVIAAPIRTRDAGREARASPDPRATRSLRVRDPAPAARRARGRGGAAARLRGRAVHARRVSRRGEGLEGLRRAQADDVPRARRCCARCSSGSPR